MQNILPRLPIALAIVIATVLVVWQLHQELVHQKVVDRHTAIDQCMQNARYTWQEKNPKDQTLANSTEEPSRYWLKLCMEEKGYELYTELSQ